MKDEIVSLIKFSCFPEKHSIDVSNMDDIFVARRKLEKLQIYITFAGVILLCHLYAAPRPK